MDKRIVRISKSLLIFVIVTAWIFSGWPQIWPLGELGVNTIRIPPEIQEAQAVTAGPSFPTSGVNDTSIGVTAWTTPGNVTASDNTRATVSLVKNSGVSQAINATGFGFAIPSDAQIDGITVEWETSEGGLAAAGGIKDNAVRLVRAGTIEATDRSNTTFWVAPASEAFVTYGGVADLWGATWTAADINNANFGAAISAKNVKVSGGGANEDAQVDAVRITVTYTLPTYTQSAYRLFNNLDSTDVGTTLAAQDTTVTLGATGALFRLRMLLHIGAAQLGTSTQNFKLQFAAMSGTCDTAFSGETYTDVTAATVIAYKDNATPADGATLTANANDPTHGADATSTQTYEELNNFTNSVATIPSGQDGKWDFSLFDNGAASSTAYCLRAALSTGTVINTYTVIPQITTASAAATVSCSTNITSTAFGALTSASVFASNSNASTTMSCSGTTSGCTLYVKDAGGGGNPGLWKSTSPTYLIPSPNAAFSTTATLAAGTEGYGIQAATTTAGSGGALLIASRYLQTGDTVGGLTIGDLTLASSSVDISNREIIVTHKAAVSSNTLSGTYNDTITYSCLSN
ncbi:MAG: hypothetical protein WC618_06185 [Patescibacteria group bacterium]